LLSNCTFHIPPQFIGEINKLSFVDQHGEELGSEKTFVSSCSNLESKPRLILTHNRALPYYMAIYAAVCNTLGAIFDVSREFLAKAKQIDVSRLVYKEQSYLIKDLVLDPGCSVVIAWLCKPGNDEPTPYIINPFTSQFEGNSIELNDELQELPVSPAMRIKLAFEQGQEQIGTTTYLIGTVKDASTSLNRISFQYGDYQVPVSELYAGIAKAENSANTYPMLIARDWFDLQDHINKLDDSQPAKNKCQLVFSELSRFIESNAFSSLQKHFPVFTIFDSLPGYCESSTEFKVFLDDFDYALDPSYEIPSQREIEIIPLQNQLLHQLRIDLFNKLSKDTLPDKYQQLRILSFHLLKIVFSQVDFPFEIDPGKNVGFCNLIQSYLEMLEQDFQPQVENIDARYRDRYDRIIAILYKLLDPNASYRSIDQQFQEWLDHCYQTLIENGPTRWQGLNQSRCSTEGARETWVGKWPSELSPFLKDYYAELIDATEDQVQTGNDSGLVVLINGPHWRRTSGIKHLGEIIFNPSVRRVLAFAYDHHTRFDEYSHYRTIVEKLEEDLDTLSELLGVELPKVSMTYSDTPKLESYEDWREGHLIEGEDDSWDDLFDSDSDFEAQEEQLETEFHNFSTKIERERSGGEVEAIKVNLHGEYFCYIEKEARVNVYDPESNSTETKQVKLNSYDGEDGDRYLQPGDIVFFYDSSRAGITRTLNSHWEKENQLEPGTCLRCAFEWKRAFTSIYKRFEDESNLKNKFSSHDFDHLIEYNSMKQWCEHTEEFDVLNYEPFHTICPQVKDPRNGSLSKDHSLVQKLLETIFKIAGTTYSLQPINLFFDALSVINSNKMKASHLLKKAIKEQLEQKGNIDTALGRLVYPKSIHLNGIISETGDPWFGVVDLFRVQSIEPREIKVQSRVLNLPSNFLSRYRD
jgi:hypothetical protein